MKKLFKNRKAFTLVELLVVIAILAILFVVLISKVDFATDKAKESGVETDFRSFQMALHTVATEQQGFTDDLDELASQLNINLDRELHVNVIDTVLISDKTDPWGTQYKIVANRKDKSYSEATVYSAGPDMTFDTEDDLKTTVGYSQGEININCEHEFTAWTIVQTGSCNVDEIVSRYCTKCGCSEDKLETPAPGHLDDGTGVCSVCGQVLDGLVKTDNFTISWEDLVEMGVIVDGKVADTEENRRLMAGKLIIPEYITEIPDYAFYNMINLTDIVLHPGITSIGDYAFYNTGITELTLWNSVGYLGVAFTGMCDLDNINLLTTYDVRATNSYGLTSGCLMETSTKTIIAGSNSSVIPSNTKIIETHAFSGRTNLATMSFNQMKINDFAFANSVIEKVTWPTGTVDKTEEALLGAFSGSVQKIIDYYMVKPSKLYGETELTSFENATITEVVAPEIMVAYLDETLLTTKKLTIACTSIKVQSMKLEEMVDRSAFIPTYIKNNPSLEIVVLEGYTELYDNMFYNCENLTLVTSTTTVRSVGLNVFKDCPNIPVEETGNMKIVMGILVEVQCDPSHTLSTNVSITDIPNTVTALGANCFSSCPHIDKITIPSTIQNISGGAFEGCEKLVQVNFAGSIYKIGNNAFKNCERLLNITLPSTVNYIGDYAFYNCPRINVTIPTQTTRIGDYAFYGCESMTGAIAIPNKCDYLGSYAFYGCPLITSVTMSSSSSTTLGVTTTYGVKLVREYAFGNCTGLTSVTFASCTSKMHVDAFSGCTSLNHLKLQHSGVVEIESPTFDYVILQDCPISKIEVPTNYLNSYKSSSDWGVFSGYIVSYTPTQCVSADTKILLADGTTKRIDELTYDDVVMVWNFETGTYDVAPISIIFYHGHEVQKINNLVFSDGTVLKTINAHGLYSVSDNNYVYIDLLNVSNYVGKEFAKCSNGEVIKVTLVDYYVTEEYTGSYCLQTAFANNYIAEGMFSLTKPDYEGWFDYFVIGDDMKYDEAQMQADIATYGLYEYEDFAHTGITYEQFLAFNGPYLKVLVGRGILTFEDILNLISNYL